MSMTHEDVGSSRLFVGNTGDATAWTRYADLLRDEDAEYDDALKAYARAQALDPDADYRLKIGKTLVLKGMTDEGLSLMRQSLQDRPRSHGYCVLADACLTAGRVDDAFAAASKAIELRPGWAEAHFMLGEALSERPSESCVDSYRKAIELDGECQQAWASLGRELVASSDTVREGVECLKRALELNEHDGWSRAYYANALRILGEAQRADENYRRAIQTLNGLPDAYHWYAGFLREQGRTGEAEEMERKASTDSLTD